MTTTGATPRPAPDGLPRPARDGLPRPARDGLARDGLTRTSPTFARSSDGPRPAPGLDALLHPMPLAALAVLLVNDHVLKPSYPSVLTGKLSGVAVLILLPFVLLAAWELVRLVRPSFASVGPRLVLASVVVTSISYVAIEVVPFAADLYRVGLGVAQWPFRAALAMVASAPAPAVAPVQLWSDPSDLLVVPFTLVVLAVGPWAMRGSLALRGSWSLRGSPDR